MQFNHNLTTWFSITSALIIISIGKQHTCYTCYSPFRGETSRAGFNINKATRLLSVIPHFASSDTFYDLCRSCVILWCWQVVFSKHMDQLHSRGQWEVISQQIASKQQHCHSRSWKGELSCPQWTCWCKEAGVLGVLKQCGQARTKPENKRWQDSNLAQRGGEKGGTIITEVFGHSPIWHLHLLRFMCSSGLHKPLHALPLTSGCFKSRSNLALMTATVHWD